MLPIVFLKRLSKEAFICMKCKRLSHSHKFRKLTCIFCKEIWHYDCASIDCSYLLNPFKSFWTCAYCTEKTQKCLKCNNTYYECLYCNKKCCVACNVDVFDINTKRVKCGDCPSHKCIDCMTVIKNKGYKSRFNTINKCDDCIRNELENNICVICKHTYSEDVDDDSEEIENEIIEKDLEISKNIEEEYLNEEMVQCDDCNSWTHLKCIGEPKIGTFDNSPYSCPKCHPKIVENLPECFICKKWKDDDLEIFPWPHKYTIWKHCNCFVTDYSILNLLPKRNHLEYFSWNNSIIYLNRNTSIYLQKNFDKMKHIQIFYNDNQISLSFHDLTDKTFTIKCIKPEIIHFLQSIIGELGYKRNYKYSFTDNCINESKSIALENQQIVYSKINSIDNKEIKGKKEATSIINGNNERSNISPFIPTVRHGLEDCQKAKDNANSNKKKTKTTFRDDDGQYKGNTVVYHVKDGNYMNVPLSKAYRNLTFLAKTDLIILKSGIEGYGVFAKRGFIAGEMLIEYCGELINQTIADKREKLYKTRLSSNRRFLERALLSSNNIEYGLEKFQLKYKLTNFNYDDDGSCYMFKLNNEIIIDATLKGNAARFINHSCNPNCTAKHVSLTLGTRGESQHIIIFAMKNIKPGEELTYDYRFSNNNGTIPCYCNSINCTKFMM